MGIPLYTSLPPHMPRFEADGTDVSEAYAVQCVDSWIASGFDPITLNAAEEALPAYYDIPGLQRVTLPRSAKVSGVRGTRFLSLTV